MLLRAIAVRAGETLTEADAHQTCLDYLMLDSGAKGPPYAGATGETHDWSISRTVVERSRVPVILAGGLSAENVAAAIATVRPWGVDSFTHTDVPVIAARKIRRGCAHSSPRPGARSRKIRKPESGRTR
jgi:phosphoribosylanthranilate isomerase